VDAPTWEVAFGWGTSLTAAVAGGMAYWKSRHAEQASKEASTASSTASDKAAEAVKLSAPTGNGFASEVVNSLGELKNMIREHREEYRSDIRRVEGKIDNHIGDHAAADVAGRRA
jgi:hydroxyethylthiazole kinase-like sugar kinase family protein